MGEQLKCRRLGCNKMYYESENGPEACRYHTGKPIFHDLKKGWTCCNQIVYDWDEFQKIQGCTVGCHSNVKEEVSFFQSNTVANAQKAMDNDPSAPKPVQPRTVDQFNKEQEAKKAAEEKKEVEMVLFYTKNGKLKCTNKGCNKEFEEEDNHDSNCNYHTGPPGFHDLRKFWTCCKKEAWDWDEFMKIPTCAVGRCVAKMVPKKVKLIG